MPPATCRALRDATNLLPATPDEAAIIIACALHSAQDLLSLARACRRFAIKCIAAPAAHRNATSGGGTAAGQRGPGGAERTDYAQRWYAGRQAGRQAGPEPLHEVKGIRLPGPSQEPWGRYTDALGRER